MPPRSVAELIDDPAHAGPLDGASAEGFSELGGFVRIGVWLDSDGRVRRARFRVTSCPALVAYAEAACSLAERERASAPVDAERIRAAVRGVHPAHRDRADAVALALSRALRPHPSSPPRAEKERA